MNMPYRRSLSINLRVAWATDMDRINRKAGKADGKRAGATGRARSKPLPRRQWNSAPFSHPSGNVLKSKRSVSERDGALGKKQKNSAIEVGKTWEICKCP